MPRHLTTLFIRLRSWLCHSSISMQIPALLERSARPMLAARLTGLQRVSRGARITPMRSTAVRPIAAILIRGMTRSPNQSRIELQRMDQGFPRSSTWGRTIVAKNDSDIGLVRDAADGGEEKKLYPPVRAGRGAWNAPGASAMVRR